jgi:hypothetical protein
MIDVLSALGDVLQLAHDTQIPHQEPAKGASGGASTVIILVGVVVTLALVGGLVWLKKRTDAQSTIHGEG